MSTKVVRFLAVLVVIVSIAGNTGVVRADHGTPPSLSVQNLEPPRAPQPQPLDIPALTIPAASSLGVQFVHVVTAANIYAVYSTIIDHPLTNYKPNAIILITPNFNPGGVGGTYDDHPIGVWYDAITGKWMIFNQDSGAMPVGAAFNVIIPTSGTGVFVHTATVGNSFTNSTVIDNALSNGNPNAIIVVTPNYALGGVCGCFHNDHPIGVYYNGSEWSIFNQDMAAIPIGAAFNVSILTAGAGIFVHTATAGNRTGNNTKIDNPLTNGNPNAIVFVTPNWNPGGFGGTYNNHDIGVYYTGGQWRIFNQDIAAMPLNAAFNVLVLVPSSDIFVHTATAGNSAGDFTTIDNALTNSHPNAIVFTTPNYNPGGVGETYNNHNIGVYYTGGQWTIFNQDFAAMPVNDAFNVLVPNPDTSVFVHKATAANIFGAGATIDYPLTNGKPNAILLVTPNWNPGDVGGTYDNHPIGVSYDTALSKWSIFNEDLAPMPAGSTFNVFVPPVVSNVFVHNAAVANISGWITTIDNALTNGNPNAIIIVTSNWNPGGGGSGTINAHPIGMYYFGGKWAIFNQDGVTMPVNAAFNVYVVYVSSFKLYLPLIMR